MNEYICATYVFRDDFEELVIGQSRFDTIEAYCIWLSCGVRMFGDEFEIVQTVIPIGYQTET